MSPFRDAKEAIANIRHPGLRKHFELEQAFMGKSSNPLVVLTKAHPQYRAWLTYFDRHVGQRPVILKRVVSNMTEAMTVVTERPEWLDPRYVP